MKDNPQSSLKSLNIIHLGITIGTILVVGIFYTIKNQSGEIIQSTQGMNVFEYLVPIFGIASFAIAYYLGKRKLKKLDSDSDLMSKLTAYRSHSLFIWAALEGSAFFAAIAFYLTGRTNLILYGAMLVVLLIYFRPQKTRISEDLNLNGEELDKLDF